MPKRNCSDLNKQFVHKITLALEQWNPNELTRTLIDGSTFNVDLQIKVRGDYITIRMPHLNFTLIDNSNNPIPGYVITYPGSNLPKDLWPVDLINQAFYLGTNQTSYAGYQLTVTTDGSINISGPNGGPIEPKYSDNGGHITNAITFSYLRPGKILCPPKNIQLSPKNNQGTNIVGSALDTPYPINPFAVIDLGDYYVNSIKTDSNGKTRVAFTWADNSAQQILPRTYTTLMFRTGLVENNKVKFGPIIDITKNTQNNIFYAESTVTINPTNLNNIVVTVYQYDYNKPEYGQPATALLHIYTTLDGGNNWIGPIIPYTFAQFPFNTWVDIDTYGNIWVATTVSISDNPPNFYGPLQYELLLSTDNGLSFPTKVFDIPTVDIAGGGFPDFGKISVGNDGSGIPGKLALWFCYDDADYTNSLIVPTIGFIPITGLGQYGSVSFIRAYDPQASGPFFTNIPSGAGGIGLSQIYVHPVNGTVYFLSTNVNDFSGYSNTLGDASITSLWVNPTGTINYNVNSFLPKRNVIFSNSNITSQSELTTRPLPWLPIRGLSPNNVRGLGVDIEKNRLYVSGWDMRPNLSNQNVLFITWTENNGESWSDPYIFNRDQKVSAGHASIDVDSITGLISAGFYSPIDDPISQQSVNYYGAIFKPPNKNIIA